MEEDLVTFQIEITCPAKRVNTVLYSLVDDLPDHIGGITRALEKEKSYETKLSPYRATAKFSVKLGAKSR